VERQQRPGAPRRWNGDGGRELGPGGRGQNVSYSEDRANFGLRNRPLLDDLGLGLPMAWLKMAVIRRPATGSSNRGSSNRGSSCSYTTANGGGGRYDLAGPRAAAQGRYYGVMSVIPMIWLFSAAVIAPC